MECQALCTLCRTDGWHRMCCQCTRRATRLPPQRGRPPSVLSSCAPMLLPPSLTTPSSRKTSQVACPQNLAQSIMNDCPMLAAGSAVSMEACDARLGLKNALTEECGCRVCGGGVCGDAAGGGAGAGAPQLHHGAHAALHPAPLPGARPPALLRLCLPGLHWTPPKRTPHSDCPSLLLGIMTWSSCGSVCPMLSAAQLLQS